MTPKQQATPDFATSSHHERVLADDLLFLEAWESGLAPWPGAVVRVRQIRRANPGVAGGSGLPRPRT